MARFKIERLESRIAPTKLGSLCGGGSKRGGSKGGSHKGGSHKGGSHKGGSKCGGSVKGGSRCAPPPPPCCVNKGCVDKGSSCC